MKKIAISLALGILLSNCEIAQGVLDVLQNEPAQQSQAPSKAPTRAEVDASGVAMIRAKAGDEDLHWTYFIALSNSNGTHSYGKSGRISVSFRGGLVVSQYVLGNDLLGVTPNQNDPVQSIKPRANWPETVTREYELPGDGLYGARKTVNCRYSSLGMGTVVIVERAHQTELISEDCAGDGLEFENRYMVSPNGFIWKSEQWAGKNDAQLIVEIIEPLD